MKKVLLDLLGRIEAPEHREFRPAQAEVLAARAAAAHHLRAPPLAPTSTSQVSIASLTSGQNW
jgi:hypothetical protein